MSVNMLMNLRVSEVLFGNAHPKLHQQFVESLDAEDQKFIKEQHARTSKLALAMALEAEQGLPNIVVYSWGGRKPVQSIA